MSRVARKQAKGYITRAFCDETNRETVPAVLQVRATAPDHRAVLVSSVSRCLYATVAQGSSDEPRTTPQGHRPKLRRGLPAPWPLETRSLRNVWRRASPDASPRLWEAARRYVALPALSLGGA